MLHIAVCDDEKVFLERIETIISEYFDTQKMEYEIDCFCSGEEIAGLCEEMKKYDIVFMDINMDNMDGIETAKAMRRFCPDTFLIFVTAFINYTLDGYKVEAIRYVLKDHESLSENIKEALDTVLEKLKIGIKTVVYDFVDVGEKTVFLNQIMYIESDRHKIDFHLKEGGREMVYRIYRKLDEVENDFDSENLVRIHQSYLVNMDYVSDVSRYQVKLENGREIPISKQRYKQTQSAYIRQKGAI